METKNTPQKKSRFSNKIHQKHREPIAAVSAGILLLVLLIVFGIGVFMIRDYVAVTNRVIQTQDNEAVKSSQETTPKLETSVLNSRYSEGDQAFQPMPDMQFVIVDVNVIHRLDSPKWFSPVLETYVKDEAGKKYELSPVILEKPFDAREYKVNEKATGELSYMIPKNASNLSWCYEVSSLSLKSCSRLQ